MPSESSGACENHPEAWAADSVHGQSTLVQRVTPHLHALLNLPPQALPEGLSEDLINACCREALLAPSQLDLASVSDVEVSLQWLDSAAMRALNRQYRGQDRPTNVLSFASELPVMSAGSEASEDHSSGSLMVLGDLVLCPQVIEHEAAEQGKPLQHHWAHLLVHGTLHLCGYDHEQAQDAQTMEDQEIRILSGLGFPDPYAVTSRSE